MSRLVRKRPASTERSFGMKPSPSPGQKDWKQFFETDIARVEYRHGLLDQIAADDRVKRLLRALDELSMALRTPHERGDMRVQVSNRVLSRAVGLNSPT